MQPLDDHWMLSPREFAVIILILLLCYAAAGCSTLRTDTPSTKFSSGDCLAMNAYGKTTDLIVTVVGVSYDGSQYELSEGKNNRYLVWWSQPVKDVDANYVKVSCY